MKAKYLKSLICIICISFGTMAQNNQKLSKSIKVEKDVTIDLNTNYVQLEIDTWNRNEIDIEAYIDGKKLSAEDIKSALDNWELKIEGSGDYVAITSEGSHGSWEDKVDFPLVLESLDVLSDIDLKLEEIPELPEMPELPELARMDMPKVPKLPELPELPEGVNNITFDTEKYDKDGEAYLERWSKEYEAKFGKKYQEEMKAWAREMAKVDFNSYEEQMQEWGEKFGKQFGNDYSKKMQAWGAEFSKRFDDEWANKMEAWGKRYGAQMEARAKSIEKRAEVLENKAKLEQEHAQMMQRRVQARSNALKTKQERSNEIRQRAEDERPQLYDSADSFFTNYNSKVKKVIKIKIPKKANLKMNVRHGTLKFLSLIENLKANLSHTALTASHIDGSSTSIDVSYSPVLVELWSQGELNLKYVKNAHILEAKRLMLNSNSSNIVLDQLVDNAIIDGSFGDLIISEISDDFSNLNIILENSDALITLPKYDFNLYFKGNRSKLNNEETSQRTIESSNNTSRTNRSIVVNAKYSDVVIKE